MSALIVWQRYPGDETVTECVSIESERLGTALTLFALGDGTVLAHANEGIWNTKRTTLDEWMVENAFHICIAPSFSFRGTDLDDGNMPALKKLPMEMRKGLAAALRKSRGHHPSWNEPIEKFASELEQA